jgi:hypothetical protein
MKDVLYRGYVLEGYARPLRSGLWSPEGRIYHQQGASVKVTPVHSRDGLTFLEAAEAENHALRLGKVAVDRYYNSTHPRTTYQYRCEPLSIARGQKGQIRF